MTRIDPVDSQPRCVHDMLLGQCSWCAGIPDLPDLDPVNAAPDIAPLGLRWVLRADATNCVRCGVPIRTGRRVAYSIYDGGFVGECCEVAA